MRRPAPTTNPYIVQLAEAVAAGGARVEYFSWPRGLSGRYDVLHVHWPEVMIRRAGRAARWAARARFALLMLVITIREIPVVRTVHNIASHEDGDLVEHRLLRWCERQTRFWILLNPDTPLPDGLPHAVILHGHYSDWFARFPTPVAKAGRVMTFGLIRPYKGTDKLLGVFRSLADPDVRLRVVGRPTTADLHALVTGACEQDARISALLRHVDDESLSAEIGQAQLVVLPYREMHNSGALILALSLSRPALVPRSPTTTALAAEVGPGWVHLYDGVLSTADLATALGSPTPAAPPDFRRRDWPGIGRAHVRAYEAALAAGRARRLRVRRK